MTTPPTPPPAEPVKVPDWAVNVVRELLGFCYWTDKAVEARMDYDKAIAIVLKHAPAIPAPAHAGELRERVRQLIDEEGCLEEYAGKDGHRDWAHHASAWLYPGDVVAVINVPRFTDALLALLSAATDGMDARRLLWLLTPRGQNWLYDQQFKVHHDNWTPELIISRLDKAMSADNGGMP